MSSLRHTAVLLLMMCICLLLPSSNCGRVGKKKAHGHWKTTSVAYEDNELGDVSSGEKPFTESNGCYNELTKKELQEGQLDFHVESCTLCSCEYEKLYCSKICTKQ